MAKIKKNVTTPVTGDWYIATSPAPAPTDGLSAIDPDYEEMGYISKDGTSEEHSKDFKEIEVHQYGATVKKVVVSSSSDFEVTFVETTEEVLRAYFGNYNDGKIEVKPGELGEIFSFIHEEIETFKDGSRNAIRNYIKEGQVTELQPIKYERGEPVSYGMKITAYPDANGVTVHKWVTALAPVPSP